MLPTPIIILLNYSVDVSLHAPNPTMTNGAALVLAVPQTTDRSGATYRACFFAGLHGTEACLPQRLELSWRVDWE